MRGIVQLLMLTHGSFRSRAPAGNVGDCRALLICESSWRRLSTDHGADNPAETERIIALVRGPARPGTARPSACSPARLLLSRCLRRLSRLAGDADAAARARRTRRGSALRRAGRGAGARAPLLRKG